MQNNSKFKGGRRFNRPKQFGKSFRRYKTDIKPEQLNEEDVGITEYVGNVDGFSGILKARFSDFQVNEININGELAKLTNTNVPEDFNLGSSSQVSTIPTETPCPDVPQKIWSEILAMLESEDDKVVEFDTTNFDKEKRGNIHRTIKNVLQRKVVASTVTKDDKKFIAFKKYNKQDKFDNRVQWPINKGRYVHFLVYKENIDTLEAAFKISDCLHMKTAAFNYAGIKDRRGKTTQWFSVYMVQPSKLLDRTRCLRNVHIGNITLHDKPLKLGMLSANKFRIAIRNVTINDDLVNKVMESLKNNGFINYYGLQRFGNDKEVPTYEVGIKLLQGKFNEACNLILKCKKCDNPEIDISQAKKIYRDKGSAAEAVKLLNNRDNSVESKLLHGLAKSNANDYVTSLENVPRNMRLLYIHAFQAFIWNKIVSWRIKEFGLKPAVGDLVLIKKDSTSSETSDVDKTEEKIESEDEEVSHVSESERKEAKILSEDDLGNYSIYDIVLPLTGYDIIYPENMKGYYKDILAEYDLSLEMPKQSVKTYTLSGDYRYIVKHVTDLSWKMVKYNDPSDDLIWSDLDELLDKPKPIDAPDGKYKALVFDFCLDPCCYATMVVREILKTDISTSAQTKLNEYHTKKEISKTATRSEETPDLPASNSLLADPAKYEDFKKSIFGCTETNDDTLKRKLDDKSDEEVAEKRSKQDENGDNTGLKVQAALV